MKTAQENLEDLEKICLELKEKNKPLYILGHEGLCYDWLGSALALKKLIKEYGIEGRIAGKIEESEGYRQNTELFNKLDLKLEDPASIEEEDYVAFVDCQPGETNTYDIKAEPIICINHHELTKKVEKELKKVKFTDIRDTRSTVAILTEYLIEKGIKLTNADSDLATTMNFGMRVDTELYKKKGQELEHKIAPYLEEFADLELIKNLEQRPIPNEVKNIMNRTIYVTKGEYQIGIVPNVSNASFVSPTADMLTKFEGYKINIVVAEIKEEDNYRFVIAGRSKDPGVSVNNFIQKLFKTGGGHWYAAGAMVPFAKMYELYGIDTLKDKSDLQQLADSIEEKISTVIEEKKSSITNINS
ncbi:MAG: hypothetical protein KKA79_04360 [Nanoarchaeota archaeon]|nr:hypothetical protein [Nanoarchaeota archaeon]